MLWFQVCLLSPYLAGAGFLNSFLSEFAVLSNEFDYKKYVAMWTLVFRKKLQKFWSRYILFTLQFSVSVYYFALFLCIVLIIFNIPTIIYCSNTVTAWKVSKYGVFSGSYFPAFWLNTARYSVSLRIQSEGGKKRTRKNFVFHLDTLDAVGLTHSIRKTDGLLGKQNTSTNSLVWIFVFQ